MTSPEDEIKDLREKNNELVQKVQYWKMTAAQRENEKLELMKEINELRLKLSRLRSGGAAQARKLDAELQTTSEEALNHLVLASDAVAKTIELAKAYMRDRQVLDAASPRWSNISGTPNKERVRRVPPMVGGQSIQPVVSLSRTILNTSNPRSTPRSPNQSRNVTERAVPMHMLQDVYIPLTRIDATDLPGHNISDTDANNMEDSTEDLGLEDSNERSLEESQNTTDDFEESSRRLDAVTEDLEEEEIETPPRRTENPLEGPSWLLDRPTNSAKCNGTRSRMNLEPDSTTECGESPREPQPGTSRRSDEAEMENAPLSVTVACEFTPTVRRRKRTASPPDAAFSPRPLTSHAARRPSNNGRVLKVLIAKMRLDGEGASPAKRAAGSPRGAGDSPAKRPVRFDAPSPNGSTDARVIVSEVIQSDPQNCGAGDGHINNVNMLSRDSRKRDTQERNHVASRDSHNVTSRDTHNVTSRDSHNVTSRDTHNVTSRDSHNVTSRESHTVTSRDSRDIGERSHSAMSRDSHDSDSGERGGEDGRARRARKAVTYKEKPLNRKMRR